MFGLTKREQRWAAEERGVRLLADVVKTALHATGQADAGELARLRAENAELRRLVSKLCGTVDKGVST